MASVATLKRGEGSIPMAGACFAKWGRSRVPSGGRVATPQPIRIPIAKWPAGALRRHVAGRHPVSLPGSLPSEFASGGGTASNRLLPPGLVARLMRVKRTRLGLPLRARRRSALSYGGRRRKVRRSPDGTWRHREGWRASGRPTSGLVSAVSVHRPRRRNLATGLLPGPARVRYSHQASWAACDARQQQGRVHSESGGSS